MVGNGNFAFTADITGLQTFQEQYSPLVPLMIEAQWGWHSFPNPSGFTLGQAEVPVRCARQCSGKYPWISGLGRGETAAHPVAAREPAQVLARPPRLVAR